MRHRLNMERQRNLCTRPPYILGDPGLMRRRHPQLVEEARLRNAVTVERTHAKYHQRVSQRKRTVGAQIGRGTAVALLAGVHVDTAKTRRAGGFVKYS